MLIQRHSDGKLTRRDELANQGVAFAKINLLLYEPAPKVHSFVFASGFYERAKEIIFFHVPTELTFPERLKQVLVALRRHVGGHELGVIADDVNRLMQPHGETIRIAPIGGEIHRFTGLIAVERTFLFYDPGLDAADGHDIAEKGIGAMLAQQTSQRSFTAASDRFDFERWIFFLEGFDDVVGIAWAPGGVKNNPSFLFGFGEVLSEHGRRR